MTHTIPANTTKTGLLELAAAMTARGANAAAFKRPGMSKVTYLPLPRLGEELALQPGANSVTFGKLTPGLPFEPLEDGVKGPAPAAPAPKAPAPTPAPVPKATLATEKDAPKPKPLPAVDSIDSLRALRLKSGTYIGYIDSLILEVESQADADDEYPRSRHNIFEAVALVSKKFPNKDVGSVKRICKVRPRHLERMKTLGIFDETLGKRAPRWALVGPGVKAPIVEKPAKKKKAWRRKPNPRSFLSKKQQEFEARDAMRTTGTRQLAAQKAWATRRANAAKKGGASK